MLLQRVRRVHGLPSKRYRHQEQRGFQPRRALSSALSPENEPEAQIENIGALLLLGQLRSRAHLAQRLVTLADGSRSPDVPALHRNGVVQGLEQREHGVGSEIGIPADRVPERELLLADRQLVEQFFRRGLQNAQCGPSGFPVVDHLIPFSGIQQFFLPPVQSGLQHVHSFLLFCLSGELSPHRDITTIVCASSSRRSSASVHPSLPVCPPDPQTCSGCALPGTY